MYFIYIYFFVFIPDDPSRLINEENEFSRRTIIRPQVQHGIHKHYINNTRGAVSIEHIYRVIVEFFINLGFKFFDWNCLMTL